MFFGITQFWFWVAMVGILLVFMYFMVLLALGVKGCTVGFSVVVQGFLLSPNHHVYGL